MGLAPRAAQMLLNSARTRAWKCRDSRVRAIRNFRCVRKLTPSGARGSALKEEEEEHCIIKDCDAGYVASKPNLVETQSLTPSQPPPILLRP